MQQEEFINHLNTVLKLLNETKAPHPFIPYRELMDKINLSGIDDLIARDCISELITLKYIDKHELPLSYRINQNGNIICSEGGIKKLSVSDKKTEINIGRTFVSGNTGNIHVGDNIGKKSGGQSLSDFSNSEIKPTIEKKNMAIKPKKTIFSSVWFKVISAIIGLISSIITIYVFCKQT